MEIRGKQDRRSPWKFHVANGKQTKSGKMGNIHNPDNPPVTGREDIKRTIEQMREKNWYLNHPPGRPTGGLKWEIMRYLLHRWPLTSPFTNKEIREVTGANMKQVSWVLTQLKHHDVIYPARRGYQTCAWKLKIRER